MNITIVLSFILVYFMAFFMISQSIKGYEKSKTSYLVAYRNAGLFESTMSMVGGWVTGIGLLVAAQQFFNNGWVGYFWFTFPQLLSLLLFAWVTIQINKKVPNGFTTTEWISKTYGRGVGVIFQIIYLFSCVGVLTTTFTAIFKYIKFVELGNSVLISGIIILGTVLYSLRGGMKVSLITGTIQTLLNFLLVSILCYLGYKHIPDAQLANFSTALLGKKNISDLFDSNLFLTFAWSAILVFMTAPTMSAAHHQKSYAQQNKQPWKAWVWGTPTYLVLQTLIAALGLLAFAWGGEVTDVSISQLFLFKSVGVIALALFGIVILNVACMMIDAHGNAGASIIANDFFKDEKNTVMVARISIAGLALIAWLVSLGNFDLTYIFFTYSTMRVNLFIILLLILTTVVLTRRAIFYTAIVMCPTTFAIGAYGIANKDPVYNTAAMTIAFFVSPAIAYVASLIERRKKINVLS
jgi:Na+/proline symporter